MNNIIMALEQTIKEHHKYIAPNSHDCPIAVYTGKRITDGRSAILAIEPMLSDKLDYEVMIYYTAFFDGYIEGFDKQGIWAKYTYLRTWYLDGYYVGANHRQLWEQLEREAQNGY